jgi:hypothetical protein
MAGRDINVPFGPDRTNGAGFEPIPAEGAEEQGVRDPFAAPQRDVAGYGNADIALASIPEVQPSGAGTYETNSSEYGTPTDVPYGVPSSAPNGAAADAPYGATAAAPYEAASDVPVIDAAAQEEEPDSEYHPGGMTDEEAATQGMDAMQMSILALKDSIGQGRELKAREREREELAEALEADHEELADREDILANYHAMVAEQDDIANKATENRDALKAELSQVTMDLDETEAALERMRAYHSSELQPLEAELGQVRATADQAKNDERSRKSELAAAEKELSRADETEANTMAIARHQQTRTAYEDARKRSEFAKDQLAQVQRAYDDARSRAEQAEEPLERKIEDLSARSESLKESINRLNETISSARNRRQYCDNVYQYPEETAKMRREVEAAEAVADQMDQENDILREQLAQSKQKARTAKIAIAAVIAIIILIIIAFIVVANR